MIITVREAVETVTIEGDVPADPRVKDTFAYDWSSKPIRPDRVRGVFSRTDGGPWRIVRIVVSGFDVLKSGKPSDNPNCYRDMQLPQTPLTSYYKTAYDGFYARQVELTAWAYEWAEIELARLNAVTERADLNSDVLLAAADMPDLDDAQPERQPRRFPLDSPQPREDGLRLLNQVNGVIFRYRQSWDRWIAEQDSGGDGNDYSWSALNSSNSEYATGEMVEVLS